VSGIKSRTPAPVPFVARYLLCRIAATDRTCSGLIDAQGHEFGTSLPNAEKDALIEYVKTL
jgi:hypothetical protein